MSRREKPRYMQVDDARHASEEDEIARLRRVESEAKELRDERDEALQDSLSYQEALQESRGRRVAAEARVNQLEEVLRQIREIAVEFHRSTDPQDGPAMDWGSGSAA